MWFYIDDNDSFLDIGKAKVYKRIYRIQCAIKRSYNISAVYRSSRYFRGKTSYKPSLSKRVGYWSSLRLNFHVLCTLNVLLFANKIVTL